MDERGYWLYAITWANCSAADFGPGVDPRFAVELTTCGQLAALVSRVGFDRFDIGKLQAGSADVKWLSEVAVRHHAVVARLAESWPVVPLRMGTLFDSPISLRTRLAQHEAQTADFLRRLGDRQEWAVKVYVTEQRAEEPHASGSAAVSAAGYPLGGGQDARTPVCGQDARAAVSGIGSQYLAAKRLTAQRRQEAQAAAQRALPTVEARLQTFADAWQRLRPLPAAITGRTEKLLYHGALLLARCRRQAFGAACESFKRQLAPEGLMLQLSGPWPPYHFCPTLQQ